MKVHIVCHGDVGSWILGKFATKLEEHLLLRGVEVSVGQALDPASDINHHIVHYEPLIPSPCIQTQMITHIDSIEKFNALKQQLSIAEVGICMSRETVEKLSSGGIQRSRLCFVNPAHDSVWFPRKRRVGITSRVYDDGRKRESFLGKLADCLDPADFEFIVMGGGWQAQLEKLQTKGFSITYHSDFNYDEYVSLIPSLDYFMYFGEDEGQMGFIDALAAGVETIAVPQGFHLDVEGGISYPFRTFEDLVNVFSEISAQWKKRATMVAEWTWGNYAQKHYEIWQYLMSVHSGIPSKAPTTNGKDGLHSILLNDVKGAPVASLRKAVFLMQLYLGFVKHKINRQFRKKDTDTIS